MEVPLEVLDLVVCLLLLVEEVVVLVIDLLFQSEDHGLELGHLLSGFLELPDSRTLAHL